ncbi:MAG TPA: nitroreductase family protein [Dehalococcoidia bacterium]|jgi:nitroreductase|nr:nitroreductase family protein [Dehalococcoidia bacterium]
MDAYKAIISKRDTRSYTEEPISEESLRRVLQAGRMAGSSKNRQPVRFVVVRDKEHMAELARCGDFSEPLGPATAAIAVCVGPEGLDFDGGRASQNVMVAAWNEGLATCPVRIHHEDCGREVLGLPEGWRISMVIAMGHPDPRVPMSLNAKRRPWEEYVRWERWE